MMTVSIMMKHVLLFRPIMGLKSHLKKLAIILDLRRVLKKECRVFPTFFRH